MVLIEHQNINSNNNDEASLALSKPNALERHHHNNEVLNGFFKLLNSQYKNYHKVSDYANELGIKPKALLRLSKKERVKNPSELIKLKLLTEAKKQLLFTEKSIRDICFDLGFSDPAYFSRFVKKEIGITAQNFRNKYANKQCVV
jgi:AraC-like DNA-binding protein